MTKNEKPEKENTPEPDFLMESVFVAESDVAAETNVTSKGLHIRIRPATANDAESIEIILSTYFLDREDIPYENFIVAEMESGKSFKIIGCAVYNRFRSPNFESFYEIHTIAVLPSYKNKGIGRQLLLALVSDILKSGEPALSTTVYTRTTSPEFFIREGFSMIENDEKKELWQECRDCAKFETCIQKALSKLVKYN
ncbi:GNAT family N-acetyltransferase [Methanolapillus millepedarum]|uniref:N-acetyltransferase domain-containing protein n=1 Tax=Methanolapillus millepedarum TaxID=3028296 RepID=A0AA96V573_9EURY|nr:hypothetical protein MsAc7_13470 [Methanosarcinaceae archaeon Ac7]